MEKFLVKTTTERKYASRSSASPTKNLKQSTLKSLKRVVVVEDLIKVKEILSLYEVHSIEVIHETLMKLHDKLPSVEILQKTKIGRVVNKLSKHSDEKIASLASDLVKKWSSDIRHRKSLTCMDVKCDKRTETLRETARRLISDALKSTNGTAKSLNGETFHSAYSVEKLLYFRENRLITAAYRKNVRKIVFALRNEKEETKRKMSNDEALLEKFIICAL